MSTKIQPAPDAGNDADDTIDPGELLTRRQLAADYARCVETRERWTTGRYSDKCAVVMRHDKLPANVRGPVRNRFMWSAEGPLEFAVGVMVTELETAIHHGSINPSIQHELAQQITAAAYAIGGLREKSLALLVPSAADVCALFDVASRVVARLEGDEEDSAVSRTAFAIAYLRARARGDIESREASEQGRVPVFANAEHDRESFAACFERALEGYVRATSANARARAMFEHFDTKSWVGDEALRKALRKPVSELDEFERSRTANHVYYYASKPERESDTAGWMQLLRASLAVAGK